MDYSLRIMPGIFLIALIYFLLPKPFIVVKIFLLMFGFILMRDAMTPMGLWEFGIEERVIWLRFIDDGFILLVLAITSLILTVGIVYFNRRMRKYLMWFGDNKIKSILAGLLGATIASAPFFFMNIGISTEKLGGVVSAELLLPLLVFSVLGNFTEEVLFRGYIQGYFETQVNPWHAVLLSGLLFALGHIFLAATVTDIGLAILLFTLYEGLICAVVRKNHGIIAATITHGLTIFVLSSGV